MQPSPDPFMVGEEADDALEPMRYADTAFATMRRDFGALQRGLGYGHNQDHYRVQKNLRRYINIKLQSLGYSIESSELVEMAGSLLKNWFSRAQSLAPHSFPDGITGRFLSEFLGPVNDKLIGSVELPTQVFDLDMYGMTRILSLPSDRDLYETSVNSTYRLGEQGVLSNPEFDKRTTQKTFLVAEGGPPAASDKIVVPRHVFGNLLHLALHAPPREHMRLAYDETIDDLHLGLYMKPTVVPGIPGIPGAQPKYMSIRAIVPASLAPALDFLEGVFGNGGDPYDPANDPHTDLQWTGHNGLIVAAPHLRNVTKKLVGLPHYDDATDYQRKEGLCWKDESELFHEGRPFHIVGRDGKGNIISLIAAFYYGYFKKTVKQFISYSSNLYGMSNEEHAGGATLMPRYGLGYEFDLESFRRKRGVLDNGATFQDTLKLLGDRVTVMPDGYAVDNQYKNIVYLPRNAVFSVLSQSVEWEGPDGQQITLKLLERKQYILPNGYMVHLERHPSWHLVGTSAKGISLRKTSTVSGGGKSELSKPLQDAIIRRPFYINDFEEDFDLAYTIINHDFSRRFKSGDETDDRTLLDPDRSIGSVISLLNPHIEYTEEYNRWISRIPYHVRSLVILLKYMHREDWPSDFRTLFSVDMVNAVPGHELAMRGRTVYANYLRCGFAPQTHNWRTFRLRQDYIPACKLQQEDDISTTVCLPVSWMTEGRVSEADRIAEVHSLNVEARYFQRPDDIHTRGADVLAELIVAGQDPASGKELFISNFAPLDLDDAKEALENGLAFYEYTRPVQEMIMRLNKTREDLLGSGRRRGAQEQEDSKWHPGKEKFWVCPDRPRIVKGKATKNIRYLQWRQDLDNPRERYLIETGLRLLRGVPLDAPVLLPVDTVMFGRRSNPYMKEDGIPPLSVYNPLHFQEMPEAILDWLACLTGKSPSTTNKAAGSEACLTKGPFNNLSYSADLNNFYLSCVLAQYDAFSSAAGFIGDNYEIAHDVSLIVPEIWCRLHDEERRASYLIENKFMDPIEDFEFRGKRVRASRLGYRVNEKFVQTFLGRIFDTPALVWPSEILRPETQSYDSWVMGIDNIVKSQQRVAMTYVEDGTSERLLPPLRILVHMAAADVDEFEGHTYHSDEFRSLFSKEAVLESDWYYDRLHYFRYQEWNRVTRCLAAILDAMESRSQHKTDTLISTAIESIRTLARIQNPEFIGRHVGTIGTDLSFCEIPVEELRSMEYGLDEEIIERCANHDDLLQALIDSGLVETQED